MLHADNTNSTMEYVKMGQGKKTFVLLSGIGMTSVLGSAEAVGSLYGRFLDEYTLYLFDRSMTIPSDATVADFARDTVACLKADGVEHAVITGMSQGGMIAQQIALDQPGFVDKLILCSSHSSPNEQSLALMSRWLDAAESDDVRTLNQMFVEYVYSEVTKSKFGEYFHEHENDGTPEQCRRFATLLRACVSFDVKDRLSEIHCPTLILGSKQDRVLGEEGSLSLTRIPNSQIYLYDGYGHAVYDEAPDFLDRIEAFVNLP